MVAQYTPGPWTVGEVDVYNDGSNLPPEIGLWVNGSTWDKIVSSITVSDANARLIAAAPELLSALEKAAAWFDDYAAEHYAKAKNAADHKEQNGREARGKTNADRANELRAAINKATTA